jgi:hypothetical protein
MNPLNEQRQNKTDAGSPLCSGESPLVAALWVRQRGRLIQNVRLDQHELGHQHSASS